MSWRTVSVQLVEDRGRGGTVMPDTCASLVGGGSAAVRGGAQTSSCAVR